jgi:hypothetical protein
MTEYLCWNLILKQAMLQRHPVTAQRNCSRRSLTGEQMRERRCFMRSHPECNADTCAVLHAARPSTTNASHSAASTVSAPFAPPHTAIGARGCTAIADTNMAARMLAAVCAACTTGGGGTRVCAR